jgi:hypothetical protein
LFKVLAAYANYNPTVGYCQGMSTVTAFILLYYQEVECFDHLVRLFKRSRMDKLYEQGFPLLFESFYLFEKLLKLYSLKSYKHIVRK